MSSELNINKTPLNSWHHDNNGQMIDFGGWEMPVQYTDGILEEHLAVRKFGGLFDVSHMGRFRIKGSGKLKFMQYVLTNNVLCLKPRQAQYTLIANETGGAVDDAYLYRFGEEDYLLVVNASNRVKVWEHFQSQLCNFNNVQIEDHSEKTGMIAFQGPLTRKILEQIIESGTLPDTSRNSLSQIKICDTDILLARSGYTGEPLCFELFVPAEKLEAVWCKIFKRGEPKGIKAIGLGARDTLRLEASMPLYGHELGLDTEGKEIPIFATPLAKMAVSFNRQKGDFIGREALWKQFKALMDIKKGTITEAPAELPKMIKPIALIGKGVARQGDEVYLEDRKIGHLTSGTMIAFWRFHGKGATMHITENSDRRAIALALVDSTLAAETELNIQVRKRKIKSQIVRWHGRSEAPPFFRSIPIQTEPDASIPGSTSDQNKVLTLLSKAVQNHQWRQQACINLIPSEQTPSKLVRLLSAADPSFRYAEHKELLAAFGHDVYYYQGAEFITWVESQLRTEMSTYLGCPQVETRAISGQMANMTVYSAFLDYKNRTFRKREPKRIRLAMNHHIGRGGHLSSQPMGALRDYISKDPQTDQYSVVNFPVYADNPYRINVEETIKLLDQIGPEIIIFGKSMVLHPEPVQEIYQALKGKPNQPLIMYDMAHVLGLIGPHFQEPFKEGADLVTGSTHKTFFGPQRGIIGGSFTENTPEYELWKTIERRAFPGMVSNHHLGTLVGLLLATIEMNAFKEQYQQQIINNAKAFAKALKQENLNVEGDPEKGYTETHQVVLNVGYGKGIQAAHDLEANNIVVNFQATPLDESFTASSALRLGVAEMTRFGMREKDFEILAGLIREVLIGNSMKQDVIRFRESFLKMSYCFDDEALQPFTQELIQTF
jgi:aminomethyltransferase